MTCPPGWSGPSPSGRCFHLTAQKVGSLRDCLARCTPACISGAADEAFIVNAGLATSSSKAWMGIYQRQLGGEYDGCVDGSEAQQSYANWRSGWPRPDTEACTYWDDGNWRSTPCNHVGLYTMPCLCEAPEGLALKVAATPAHVLEHLATIENSGVNEQWRDHLCAMTFQLYAIGLLIAFTPAIIYFASQYVQSCSVRLFNSASVPTEGPNALVAIINGIR